jgi:uncharacterized LabA/DUF88 family protein
MTDTSEFLRSDEKTAVFIDGQNLYASMLNTQIKIDYRKLRGLFSTNTNLFRIYYYAALLDNSDYDPLHKLVDWLSFNGYTTVTKQVKEFPARDGNGTFRKGNMDVDLTVDVLRMSPFVDHIVLMSGDGDFKSLVQEVQRRCRVTVISTPDVTSAELKRQCDQYIDLRDLHSCFSSRASLQAAG